ncbi:unnamed protein product [Calypogeia fissa]
MENDHSCQIVGIGSVKIRMFDGTIRLLMNARHIPDMKRNLISLEILDSKGYYWNVVGGVLQVMAGASIILKGNKCRNLYVLEGNTMIGQANATISSVEKMQLWHMQLGHMSSKGMGLFHKRGLLPSLQSSKLAFCEHCIYGKNHRKAFGT